MIKKLKNFLKEERALSLFTFVFLVEFLLGTCLVFKFFGNPIVFGKIYPECFGMFSFIGGCFLKLHIFSSLYVVLTLIHTNVQYSIYKSEHKERKNYKSTIFFNIVLSCINLFISFYFGSMTLVLFPVFIVLLTIYIVRTIKFLKNR